MYLNVIKVKTISLQNNINFYKSKVLIMGYTFKKGVQIREIPNRKIYRI